MTTPQDEGKKHAISCPALDGGKCYCEELPVELFIPPTPEVESNYLDTSCTKCGKTHKGSPCDIFDTPEPREAWKWIQEDRWHQTWSHKEHGERQINTELLNFILTQQKEAMLREDIVRMEETCRGLEQIPSNLQEQKHVWKLVTLYNLITYKKKTLQALTEHQ